MTDSSVSIPLVQALGIRVWICRLIFPIIILVHLLSPVQQQRTVINSSEFSTIYSNLGEDSEGEDFGSSNYRPYNRGNKLKRLLEQPHLLPSKPTLWPVYQIDEDLEYVQTNGRRMIMRKGQRRVGATCQLFEDDPYKDIDMDEIWCLPESPSDLQKMPPVKHTLKSHDLQILARKAMAMVEEEARLYRTLCQFTEMLQGDDPDTQDMNILEGLSESVATELQDDVEDLLGCVTETIGRLQDSRKFLIKASIQKRELADKLRLL
ncbi:hypothetical protein BDEG_21358 [Batrachochytrium dendrobatidis JEL423]|uniref:Transcriptional regulatory protein RXT2 N-terminal domain-containing protein n=1 Tax=Batrachochytrium dendrobatidis (strain JEL423) TaxID=403673 RepID=A0A177WBB5_BATDL|nr:hypothetical protein O5D80_004630 [Batrachochytrium dendrobatidis]OAJ37323.1 hypothetical protein BDEG_21358 [Batrachochytrium dendrobatidis JEL423]